MSELDKVSDYDDSIMGLYKRVDSNRIDLGDLILEIRRVQENIVVNTDELERINEIIAHIEMLKRKYGGSITSVVEHRDKIIQSETDSGICKEDINKLEKGGLSGKPIEKKINELINHFYRIIGKKIKIIGVGGVDSGKSIFEKNF